MQELQVCSPTKIDQISLFLELSSGYRLIISRTDGGDLFPHPTLGNAWDYKVLMGDDETGWYPQNSGKEEYNSTIVSKVLSVVSGWKFLYEGAWPSWEDVPEAPTVSMECCMCDAQGEFEDLDEAYCGGWYVNDGDDYCPSHAEEGIKEADEQWESRMR